MDSKNLLNYTKFNKIFIPSFAYNCANRNPCRKQSSVDLTETSTSSKDPVVAVVSTDPSQLMKYFPRSMVEYQVVRN